MPFFLWYKTFQISSWDTVSSFSFSSTFTECVYSSRFFAFWKAEKSMKNNLKGQPKMCIANVPTGQPVVSRFCNGSTSRERRDKHPAGKPGRLVSELKLKDRGS